MDIKRITQDEFDKYNVIKKPSGFLTTEKRWYVEKNHNILGIILLDNIDNDWSYVILAIESGNSYSAIEVKVSMDTILEAENLLLESINSIVLKGQKEDTLFKIDDDIIKEPLNLIVTDIDEEIKKYFKKHPEKLYDLSPRKFEELIASIFVDLGFNVELTKATRDGGRDIIASIKNKVSNFLAYVECKRYSPDNKIGIGLIREVLGVHYIEKPSKSIIVTTSFFSKVAKQEAVKFENQLDLKDYNDIKNWLQNY